MRQTGTAKTSTAKPSSKKRFETPSSQKTSSDSAFYQKVQEKAYELFVARGCADGHDVEDWVTAEQIVRAV